MHIPTVPRPKWLSGSTRPPSVRGEGLVIQDGSGFIVQQNGDNILTQDA